MVLFSEDHIQETRRRGRIEVICGSMFSGKTEELIRRMKRAKFAKQRVEIFKPAIDTRYSEEDVVSHDSHSIASTPIDSSASILPVSYTHLHSGNQQGRFVMCHRERTCKDGTGLTVLSLAITKE